MGGDTVSSLTDLYSNLVEEFNEEYVSLYDCGVEGYYGAHEPHIRDLSDEERAEQEDNLKAFLKGDKSGILLTWNQLFGGMEAPTVVYFNESVMDAEVRSAIMRSVGRLVIITNTEYRYLDRETVDQMSSHVTVHIDPGVKGKHIKDLCWDSDVKVCDICEQSGLGDKLEMEEFNKFKMKYAQLSDNYQKETD